MFTIYHFMAAGTIATQERPDGLLDMGITYLKPGDVYDPEIGVHRAKQRCKNAKNAGPKSWLKLLPGVHPDKVEELVVTMRYAEQCGIANSATLRGIILDGPEKVQNRIQLIVNDAARTKQRWELEQIRQVFKKLDAEFDLIEARISTIQRK